MKHEVRSYQRTRKFNNKFVNVKITIINSYYITNHLYQQVFIYHVVLKYITADVFVQPTHFKNANQIEIKLEFFTIRRSNITQLNSLCVWITFLYIMFKYLQTIAK